MKTTFISLGGGCDVAWALERLSIREASYPFDWLWNLDTGLFSVNQIIDNNFTQLKKADTYQYSTHYRFGNNTKIIYKDFPSIVHLHSNPLVNEHDHKALERRISRFEEALLEPNTSINFIYYRNYDEAVIKDPSLTLTTQFHRLLNEGIAFRKLMSNRFPKKRFRLLLVFQTTKEYQKEALEIIKHTIKDKSLVNDSLKLGYTLTRDDSDKQELVQWEEQWDDVIIRNCYFGLVRYGFIFSKHYFKIVKWNLKSLLKLIRRK